MAVHSGYAATIPSTAFRFTSPDGLCVACPRWDTRGPVRDVVQIAHGMGDHIGRYVGTIDVLVAAGLTIYGNDHRGQDRTAPSATHFGDFGEGGFDLLVEEMLRCWKDTKVNPRPLRSQGISHELRRPQWPLTISSRD